MLISFAERLDELPELESGVADFAYGGRLHQLGGVHLIKIIKGDCYLWIIINVIQILIHLPGSGPAGSRFYAGAVQLI